MVAGQTTSQYQHRENAFSQRQQEVLSAVLNLLVKEGGVLTMEQVAKRANCSKETLYKWFGDRQGLLTATVQWQAAKVRGAPVDHELLDKNTLAHALQRFAQDWLEVLTGDISIALNRMAITHAGNASSDLGNIVLNNGPIAMARRLIPVLELGRDAGLLTFNDSQLAFRSYFGLVVRDVQIRALLGEPVALTKEAIKRDAERATEQFFSLFGTSVNACISNK